MKQFRADYEIAESTSDDDARSNLADIHDNQLSKRDFQQKQQT